MLRLAIFILLIPIVSTYAQQADTAKIVINGIVQVPEDTTGLFFAAPKIVEGRPRVLPNTTISLLDPADSSAIGGTIVDSLGKYVIKGVTPGTYIIRAFYIGYEETTELIIVNREDTLRKDFILGEVYPPNELPFGAEEAQKNFEAGNVTFRQMETITLNHTSLYVPPEVVKKIDACKKKVHKKYNVTYKTIQQEFEAKGWDWHKIRQASIRYNEAMKKLLKKRNGPNWYKRFQKERDECFYRITRQYKDSVKTRNCKQCKL